MALPASTCLPCNNNDDSVTYQCSNKYRILAYVVCLYFLYEVQSLTIPPSQLLIASFQHNAIFVNFRLSPIVHNSSTSHTCMIYSIIVNTFTVSPGPVPLLKSKLQSQLLLKLLMSVIYKVFGVCFKTLHMHGKFYRHAIILLFFIIYYAFSFNLSVCAIYS